MKSFTYRKQIFKQRKFRYLLILLVLISLLIGIAVVPLERGGTGSIKNVSDGLWWAVTTITTVGYGDTVPVTPTGRLLGVLLQLLGASIFGMVVATLSNYVSRSQDEFYWGRLFERIDRLELQVEELKKRTGYIVKNDDVVEVERQQNLPLEETREY